MGLLQSLGNSLLRRSDSLDSKPLDEFQPLERDAVGVYELHRPFVGWKKGRVVDDTKPHTETLIELVLPAGATLVIPDDPNSSLEKLRTDEVRVKRIQKHTDREVVREWMNESFTEINECANYHGHASRTLYRVGETVTPDRLDSDTSEACSYGIHLFPTKEQAKQY